MIKLEKTVGRDGSARPPGKPGQYHAMINKGDLINYQVFFLQIITHIILMSGTPSRPRRAVAAYYVAGHPAFGKTKAISRRELQ